MFDPLAVSNLVCHDSAGVEIPVGGRSILVDPDDTRFAPAGARIRCGEWTTCERHFLDWHWDDFPNIDYRGMPVVSFVRLDEVQPIVMLLGIRRWLVFFFDRDQPVAVDLLRDVADDDSYYNLSFYRTPAGVVAVYEGEFMLLANGFVKWRRRKWYDDYIGAPAPGVLEVENEHSAALRVSLFTGEKL